MSPRRHCFPNCKPAEKRDFMDVNPERTAEDFYRSYDPTVGIGTVGILLVMLLMVSLKSMIKWGIEKYRLWVYDRQLKQVLKKKSVVEEPKETVTFLCDSSYVTGSSQNDANGLV